MVGVRKGNHPGTLVSYRQPGASPLLFASRHGGSHLPANARGQVVCVVMVEVGFDVLRVIEIAVVTFTVVFPHKLPVGVDQIIHGLGYFGGGEALRLKNRRKRLLRVLEGW